MRMVDLFSGLGGASQAFLDNGWDVERYDNNPLFYTRGSEYYVPFTDKWCAMTDNLPGGKIDFLWLSPPCYEFSTAFAAPRSKAQRAGIEYEPDMQLIERSVQIIDELKPRFWALENVMGSSKYLSKYFGKHRVILDSALIWGNFPIVGFKAMEKGRKKRDGDKARYSPIRSNERAKIPYWLSEQMRIAVQYQMMLSDFEESLADLSWVDDILEAQRGG